MRTTLSRLGTLALPLFLANCGDDDSAALVDVDSGTSQETTTDDDETNQDASVSPISSSETSSSRADGGTTEAESPHDAASDAAIEQPADASASEQGDSSVTEPADAGSSFDGTCASLPGKIVYVESGDTQENLLKRVGRLLRDEANITLAFNLTGSCTLINDIYTNTAMVPNGMLKYIPSTTEDPNWLPSMPAATCTTSELGAPIDLAISALFVESCGLGGAPDGSGLALLHGPVQAYTFIVPTASDQAAIWAEEAYYTFGFGNDNPLAPTYHPWNKEEFLFIRPVTKSTLVATAKNIAVPPANWKGQQLAASTDVLNAVANSVDPQATLGILGAEVYDNNRDKGIKTLAFQAFGQSAAYYPDSSANAFDKQNVRDGHYTLWSPTVYITKVAPAGTVSDPYVKLVVDSIFGNTPSEGAPEIDGLSQVVKVGLIPDCAMHVTRSEDGADLSPYTAEAGCDCFYKSQLPGASGAPAGCVECDDASQCAPGSCNHGYCEPSVESPADAGCVPLVAGSHEDIINNTCTDAVAIEKEVELPSDELTPLP